MKMCGMMGLIRYFSQPVVPAAPLGCASLREFPISYVRFPAVCG